MEGFINSIKHAFRYKISVSRFWDNFNIYKYKLTLLVIITYENFLILRSFFNLNEKV
jgi:hypothetical protein